MLSGGQSQERSLTFDKRALDPVVGWKQPLREPTSRMQLAPVPDHCL
jgi:hypothetical protein